MAAQPVAQHEVQWEQFRSQIEKASGFWLGFVFTSSASKAMHLSTRASGLLRSRGLGTATLRPESADELRNSLSCVLQEARNATGCLFLESTYDDVARTWIRSWVRFLLHANGQREELQVQVPGGLVFVAPPAARERVRAVAPELWSIRNLELELDSGLDSVVWMPPTTPQFTAALRRQPEAASSADFRSLRRAAPYDAALAAKRASLLQLRAAEEHEQGRFVAALRDLEAAAALDGSHNLSILRDLAQLRWQGGQWTLARDAFLERASRARRLMLAEVVATPAVRAEYAAALMDLGIAQERIGALSDARVALIEAVDIYRSLRGLGARPEVTIGVLADALTALGSVELSSGGVSSAIDLLGEALDVLEQQPDEMREAPDVLRRIAIALDLTAFAECRVGRFVAAREAILASICALQKLPESPQRRIDLSRGSFNLGIVETLRGSPSASRAAFARSVAHLRELRRTCGDTVQLLGMLSQCWTLLGQLGRRAVFEGRRTAHLVHTPRSLTELPDAINEKLSELERVLGMRPRTALPQTF